MSFTFVVCTRVHARSVQSRSPVPFGSGAERPSRGNAVEKSRSLLDGDGISGLRRRCGAAQAARFQAVMIERASFLRF